MRNFDEQKYRKLIKWLRADVLCLAEEQFEMNHIVSDAMEELVREILMGGTNMDNTAIEIVRNYILEHLDKSDPTPEFEVFTVWKAKVLQNWKYLLSSTLFDGMYYELTYNGDKGKWYLDAYKKFENRVVNVE